MANLSDVTDDVPGTFKDAVSAISECDNVSEALQLQVGDTGKTVEQIFGKKAAQELATNIQNGSFAIDEWTATLQDNEGALDSTSEGVTTMGDAWSQATNNVSMAVGSTLAPVISDVVKKVADVITKVSQVVQKSPALQAVVVGIATALGVLAGALAALSVIKMVTTLFQSLNLTLMANPVFLVVTALAALAAGLVYAYKHCETFRNIVNAAFNVIKSVVLTAIEAVKTGVTTAFNTMKTVISTIMTTIETVISTVWATIKTAVSTAVTAIETTVSTVFTAIKTTASSVWNGIKTVISGVVNGIKTTVSTVFNAVKTTVSSVFNGIKTTASTVWNAIKTAVTTPISSAKTAVSSTVNGIKTTVSSVFSSLKISVSNTWNSIKTAMTKPIESAKSTISGIVDKIKGLFPLSIGKIFSGLKLPHISVDGGQAPFGIAGKGRLPSFSVSWYKMGAIFRKPTIFGTALGWTGVGEAGPEAVAPIDTLKQYVEEAVEAGSTTIDYDHLADKVATACARMNISINLDDRTLGRVVREMV